MSGGVEGEDRDAAEQSTASGACLQAAGKPLAFPPATGATEVDDAPLEEAPGDSRPAPGHTFVTTDEVVSGEPGVFSACVEQALHRAPYLGFARGERRRRPGSAARAKPSDFDANGSMG
ncbi:MAG: hypothetical protein INH41_06605 [Myxococcaceae bacterium]|nr:hypothetical protein [Myxococcaceae bacterium]MCA3012060.1 hypothetical protein [Myxococcaceae bacterium]